MAVSASQAAAEASNMKYDEKYAMVPYLNNGALAVAGGGAAPAPPVVVTQHQFGAFIKAIEDTFKCPYFERLNPDTYGVAFSKPAKDGDTVYINWLPRPPGNGRIRTFGPPTVVATADMPPHGNLKAFLSAERQKSNFFPNAPKELKDADMSIGLSTAPYGDQTMDSAGRGEAQGRFQDFVKKLDEKTWNAVKTRHPEVLKRFRRFYEAYQKAECSKCKDEAAKARGEVCMFHDPLTKESEDVWNKKMGPQQLEKWWAPVVRPSGRGPTLFCSSTIWQPLEEFQPNSKRVTVLDPELMAEKDHQEAYKAGYYMRDTIRAFNVKGERLPYKEAVLLRPGDLIIPFIEINPVFKHGNDMGKFRLEIPCTTWILLQRNVRTVITRPAEGVDFSSVLPPEYALAPFDNKFLEEREQIIPQFVTFVEKETKPAKETIDIRTADRQNKKHVPPPGGYKRLELPMLPPPAHLHPDAVQHKQKQLPPPPSYPKVDAHGDAEEKAVQAVDAMLAAKQKAESATAAATVSNGTSAPGKRRAPDPVVPAAAATAAPAPAQEQRPPPPPAKRAKPAPSPVPADVEEQEVG